MSRFGLIDARLTLPIRYFGPVDYYAAMGACARVVIDDNLRYDKRQKDTHRLTVADTHGVKTLTVPVSKPVDITGPLRWNNIGISRHGQWWHVMFETLASAYGRTPFFEFYIDRFRRFFASSTPDAFDSVAALCRGVDTAVRRVLCLDNDIVYASDVGADEAPAVGDTRCQGGRPYPRYDGYPSPQPVEYYQVRHDKFGFVPSLSILDLIFNMGPESPLILKKMIWGPGTV